MLEPKYIQDYPPVSAAQTYVLLSKWIVSLSVLHRLINYLRQSWNSAIKNRWLTRSMKGKESDAMIDWRWWWW